MKKNLMTDAYCLCFFVLIAILLNCFAEEDSKKKTESFTEFTFVPGDIISIIESPTDSNTYSVHSDNYHRLQDLKRFHTLLEINLKEIIGDENLRKRDPNALIRAASLAGVYRMKHCVPELVKIITLQGNYMDELDDGGAVFDGSNPNARRERFESVADVLIKIGDPSVEHVLKLADSEKATKPELEKAGYVLKGIEGGLAYYVVEDYIKKSPDPDSTRKLLEREPFKNYWQKKE